METLHGFHKPPDDLSPEGIRTILKAINKKHPKLCPLDPRAFRYSRNPLDNPWAKILLAVALQRGRDVDHAMGTLHEYNIEARLTSITQQQKGVRRLFPSEDYKIHLLSLAEKELGNAFVYGDLYRLARHVIKHLQ